MRPSLLMPFTKVGLLVLLATGMAIQLNAQPTTEDGFAIPQAGTRLSFPKDHGSHPAYGIEWWYYTGQLFGEDGHHYGFQATFFRREGPFGSQTDRPVAFGAKRLYLAHMALVDAETGEFLFEERLNRDGWDAAASTDELDLYNGNWRLWMTDAATEAMRLQFSIHDRASADLRLLPQKPRIQFGEDGLSHKGAAPDAVSYYISFTRLQVSGQLTVNGRTQAVSGQAWMDHEIASRQLGPGLAGWDWTAIQLDDGREIKAYILRREDGNPDPYSLLAWIDKQGAVTYVPVDDFQWRGVDHWKSPHTGGEYPIEVEIKTVDPSTGQPTTLHLKPVAPDQEITGDDGGIAYWEGACTVHNSAGEQIGYAYLELVGYAASVQGRL